MNDYSVRAVERALTVMSVLGNTRNPLTLTEIAAQAGLNTATTFRLLWTLQKEGMVLSLDDGKYRLGYRVLQWTEAVLKQTDVLVVSRPVLDSVRDQVDESTGLAVPAGHEWVRVAWAEPSHTIRPVMSVGERSSLLRGPTGRVFMAAFSDEELSAFFQRFIDGELTVPVNARLPFDPESIRRDVQHVRDFGFGEVVHVDYPHTATIGAPVWNHDGVVVAALSITGPSGRYTPQARRQWVTTALEAAREISTRLGFHGTTAYPHWPTAVFDLSGTDGELPVREHPVPHLAEDTDE
jgi:DNA-binding IclR family transcriptional regulator